MKKPALRMSLLSFLLCLSVAFFTESAAQTVSSFTTQTDGALCMLSNGARLKLQVCAGNIIRVVYTTQTTIPAPQGFIVGKTTFTPGAFTVQDNGTAIVVATQRMSAMVNKANSVVSFANSSGTTVCSEVAGGRTLAPVSKGGQAGFSGTLGFNSPASEGVYGLGNLSAAAGGWTEEDYWCSTTLPPDRTGNLNIRNYSFDMHQTNWMDVLPFFMTTSGYGVLMNFCCHATKTAPLNFTADFLLNNAWDYFFIYGPQFDTIISGYRNITGPAPMFPKWAYGYWQCKNRYSSSAEINTAVSTFRSNNIPLDCIVQDWSWWSGTTAGYGSFTWDTPYTNPAPATWISTLHANNAHLALSVWGNFSTGTINYNQMSSHLLTNTCNGTASSPGVPMNIFDTTAAKLFWGYMNTACYSAGVDAWWMDATEPECELLTGQMTSYGVIDLYSNALALAHAKNIYERQRAVPIAKRVVNLTRSFYGGQQRFGTIYWNGDLSGSDMANVATTVAGGLNSCMGGNPYWCSDIGGFQNAPTDEILTRWFQAGTFFPIFRIHGSRNTEIYNMTASPRQIATAFSRLRYRLMPYIYSLAWKVTNEGYTMTRALPFDFPSDANVINIANQFMFGSALLVNPIVTTGQTSRNVYLPGGTWYDFWTGTPNANTAGRNVNASAPLSIIPIYARAGAILPMGPRIQYATEKKADTIELRVYPGADGSFTLYEDENDNYNYETGSYATIPITYSNATGKVTIGSRTGSFTGMLTNRVFNIVFVSAGHGIADTITKNPDCVVNYNGAAVTACPVTGICKECMHQDFIKDQPFTVKTADEKIVFPSGYAGAVKDVAVYNLSGRLLQKATFKKQSVSLKKDFGLSKGSYVVKVKLLR